jgi:hypothetical protein
MSSASRVILGLCWLWATPALAQAQAQPEPAQSTSQDHPFVTEVHTGLNDPLGRFGLALVYDRGGRFSAGLGLGLSSTKGDTDVAASLFGRLRLLRLGIFNLDTGTILSRGSFESSHTYSPPAAHEDDHLTWTWRPDYRLTGTLAAELAGRRWSLRLEGGLAYHLNRPTCHYSGAGTWFEGDCQSEYIPEPYHFSREPGRISPSVSLTLGYRLGVQNESAVAQTNPNPEYRSPGRAQALSTWSTVIPVLLGMTVLELKSNSPSRVTAIGAVSVLGLGVSFGPSIGYGYAGEPFRGWGMGILRAALFGLGSASLLAATSKSNCEEDCSMVHGYYTIIGYSLMGLSAVSAAYDIFAVPKAAERANARHGLTNLSLLPMPIAGSKSVGPGIVLGGQF